jgi:iron complex outermembrane receptor protein
MNKTTVHGLVAVVLAGALLGGAPPAIADQAGSAQDSTQLSEIIVTAQKRSETAQSVPATLDVLSADQLLDKGYHTIEDYQKEIPALFVSAGLGPGTEAPVIRGMSTGGANGGNGLVTVYIDDVSFSTAIGLSGQVGNYFDPSLLDLDHVEVLEGPQSTLYGANAMTGVIKYVTKQPDLSNYSVSVRGELSQNQTGGQGYAASATVNIPIVNDKLAIRVSGEYRGDPGFIDNVFYNKDNLNVDNVRGGRIAILYDITDNLKTTLTALTQTSQTDAPNIVYVNPQTLKPSLGVLGYSSSLDPIIDRAQAESVNDTTVWTTPFATVTNVFAFVETNGFNQADYSLYPSFFGAPSNVGAEWNPYPGTRERSDEFRLATTPGTVEGLAGLYWFDEYGIYDSSNRPYSAVTGQELPPSYTFPSGEPFFDLFDQHSQIAYLEYAVFGDLTYHPIHDIDATFGIRRSWIDQHEYQRFSGLVEGGTTYQNSTTHEDSTSYLGTVSWHPTPGFTGYFRVSSAYHPGGSDLLAPKLLAAGINPVYKASTMWNYEVGAKGDLFGGRMSYTLTGFRMLWKDLQIEGVLDGLGYEANAGSARSDGVEGSVRFKPVRNLTVSLNAAYVDARITADVPTLNAVDGQPLPQAAKVSGSASLDYRFAPIRSVSPFAGMTYAYRGTSYSGFSGAGFGVTSYQMPGYSTLDLRAGVDWSNYSVMFRIANATNSYGIVNVQTIPAIGGPLGGSVIPPRTYSLAVAANF